MAYSKRLNKEDAIKLGFEPKESNGNINPKYYFNDELIYKFNLPAFPNNREFIEVQRKLGKNGELLSSVEKLQSEPIEVPENFEIVKVSTSKTTGQQWVQYQPKKVETEIQEIAVSYTHLTLPTKRIV